MRPEYGQGGRGCPHTQRTRKQKATGYRRLALLFVALSAMLDSCASPPRTVVPAVAPSVPKPALPTLDIASPAPGLPPTVQEIAAVEQKVRLNGRDAQTRLALAELYMRAGKLPNATRELRKVEQMSPDNVEAHRRLATLYHESDYQDREYEELRQVAILVPDDWQSALRLADIALDQGWFDVAEPALDQAAKAAPQEPKVSMGRATLALMRHQYPKMEAFAREGLRLAPKNAAFRVVLSDACRLQGRLPEAERELRDAITQSGDSAVRTRYKARLAHLLLEVGWNPERAPDAEQAAQAALELSPNDVEARYWLARAQERQGHMAEAEVNYVRVAQQDVQFENVAYSLGRIYQRASDPSRRREGQRLLALDKAANANMRQFSRDLETVRQKPNDAVARRILAQWYVRTGRLPQAILELRRALEINSRDRQARRMLGATLRSMGRTTEAKQYDS